MKGEFTERGQQVSGTQSMSSWCPEDKSSCDDQMPSRGSMEVLDNYSVNWTQEDPSQDSERDVVEPDDYTQDWSQDWEQVMAQCMVTEPVSPLGEDDENKVYLGFF